MKSTKTLSRLSLLPLISLQRLCRSLLTNMAPKKEDSVDALTKQVQQLGINGSEKETTVAVKTEEHVLDSARAALVEAISQRQKLMGKVTEASKRNSTRAFPDELMCKHAQAVTKLMQEQDQALDKLLVEFAKGPAAEKDAKKTSHGLADKTMTRVPG